MDSKVLIGKIKELNKKLSGLCTGAVLRQLKSGILYGVGKVNTQFFISNSMTHRHLGLEDGRMNVKKIKLSVLQTA